ncbi:hypothetical protein GGR57DRAFT_370211 [Xylariaceae sp. FL1272]|nr:hypothetical protein GGR57DRAFT_370211 [Xylariaceae sp. FL1272]
MIPRGESRPASLKSALVSGEHTPTNPPTRKTKTRSACDRCHAQKLKCKKSSSQDSCDRCFRQGLCCVFSPRITRNSRTRQHVGSEALRLRSLVPSPPRGLFQGSDVVDIMQSCSDLITDATTVVNASQITLPNDSQENHSAPNLGTPIIHWCDIEDLRNGPPDIEPQAHTVFNAPFISTMEANDENCSLYPHGLQHTRMSHMIANRDPCAELPLPSMIGKLAELNLSIYKCAKKLPSVNSIPPNATPRSGSSSPRTFQLFVLDDLFHLSEELIDAMSSLTLKPLEGPAASTETVHGSLNTASAESQNIDAFGLLQLSKSMSHLDYTTSIVVLSCHYQLVDIYTSLFHLIQLCSQNCLRLPVLSPDSGVLLPRIHMGGSVSCPPVRVDVHTPLPPATVTTYINVITMASSRLWTRLAESMTTGFLQVMKEELALDSESCALSASWNTAFNTTSNLSNTIEATKQMLQLC